MFESSLAAVKTVNVQSRYESVAGAHRPVLDYDTKMWPILDDAIKSLHCVFPDALPDALVFMLQGRFPAQNLIT